MEKKLLSSPTGRRNSVKNMIWGPKGSSMNLWGSFMEDTDKDVLGKPARTRGDVAARINSRAQPDAARARATPPRYT